MNPHVKFYAYTRSWRKASLLKNLIVLSKLSNWQLWFSEDRETGPSPRIKTARRAFMVIDETDEKIVHKGADLVFRDEAHTVVKKMNGVQVCPYETGIPYQVKMTCARCGICWKPEK
jgi:hypothetical protein